MKGIESVVAKQICDLQPQWLFQIVMDVHFVNDALKESKLMYGTYETSQIHDIAKLISLFFLPQIYDF